jgi:prevent-host-death family protein
MRSWQLQEAKARLSEVVKSSQREGPQEISVRGEPAVVVLAKAEYDRLRRRKPSLLEFLRRSPLTGLELQFERDRTLSRDLPL